MGHKVLPCPAGAPNRGAATDRRLGSKPPGLHRLAVFLETRRFLEPPKMRKT